MFPRRRRDGAIRREKTRFQIQIYKRSIIQPDCKVSLHINVLVHTWRGYVVSKEICKNWYFSQLWNSNIHPFWRQCRNKILSIVGSHRNSEKNWFLQQCLKYCLDINIWEHFCIWHFFWELGLKYLHISLVFIYVNRF